MDKALYEEMYQLEQRHWWFAAKRRIVLSLLESYLPRSQSEDLPRVADIGCGCGMMLRDLLDNGYDAFGIDASEVAREFCRQRGVEVVAGELPGGMDVAPASMDAVLMLDVLEHIDDDAAAFGEAANLVRPGGIVICTVPAYQWLWTPRDEFHHHKRRYNRGQLRTVLCAAENVGVEQLSYMNSLLFPLACVSRMAEKLIRRKDNATDLTVPALGLNRALQAIFQSERRRLSRGRGFPFGLSLVGVVRKQPTS